ncbi:MAG: alpha-amylase family glycosyl hydrolase [Nocardioidaceae bacterium]
MHLSSSQSPWWQHAVCYQIYVRSFADSDGDGVGDMSGIEHRLPYLADLGVDAVWITPFYPSPQHDHGYDVRDYRDVEPLFGTLADFDRMLGTAHDLGIRVIVDVVPNHTSEEHPWFREALAAAPGDPVRDRYVFRDGTGRDGSRPPNNWLSMFGGPAWTRLPDGQWYLHLFDATQPDLNWWNDQVGDEFESILRFWLDRGVDGFRIDVAHGLYKPFDLTPRGRGDRAPHPMWDQPEVHEVYRRWHKVLAEYPGDRMAVAEAWSGSPESMARYIRPDELQQTFNFSWLQADWSAAAFRRVVLDTFEAVGLVDATPTWVLSNHDVVRETTRYGGGPTGVARARAAALTMMALPGSAYVYQGEELGLEQVDVAPEDRQDPSWFRTGEAGRDGCRVPVPWSGTSAPYGFGPGAGQPWLPMPADWAALTVEAQSADEGSTLSFFRRMLRLRRQVAPGLPDAVEVLDSAPGTMILRRGDLVCVVNCGSRPSRLPAVAGELLLSSGATPADGRLAPDTAAWFRPA